MLPDDASDLGESRVDELDVDDCRERGCRSALGTCTFEAEAELLLRITTPVTTSFTPSSAAATCFSAVAGVPTRRPLTVFSFSPVSAVTADRAFSCPTVVLRTGLLASSSAAGGGSTSGVVLRRLLRTGAVEPPPVFIDAEAPPVLPRRLCVAGTTAVFVDDADDARGRVGPGVGPVDDEAVADAAVSRTMSETGPPEGRACMLPTSALFLSFSLGCLSRAPGRAGTSGTGAVSCSGGAGDRSVGTDFRRVTGRLVT